MKYTIQDEYGTHFPNTYDYDTACRIAHYMRKLGGFELYVVSGEGRAMSEVVDIDGVKDHFACVIAKKLLSGDYESRLI